MMFRLGCIKKSTYTSCICIYSFGIFSFCGTEIQILLFKNDGNHPGLGLDINIINQIDDGDVTEGIDSGLEAILGLSRALLVVRKCENKRNL